MWLFLGLAAVVTATVYFARRRGLQRWQGEPLSSVASREAQYLWDDGLVSRLLHGGRVLRIGERGVPGIDLLVKPIRWSDRLFRVLGLSLSCRTHDRVLAERAYIASDHVRCCAALRTSERARQGLRRLLALESDYAVVVRGIHFRDRRMWVELRSKGSFAEEGIDGLGREVVECLRQVAANLSEALPEIAGTRDRFALWATVLVGLSSALLVTGLVQIVRVAQWQTYPWVLDQGRVALLGIGAGLALVALLTVSAIAVLGRTARTHIVLVELWSAGLIGALLNGYVMVRDLNHEFDRTPARAYRVEVHDKDRESRTHGTSDYYLVVDDWSARGDTFRQQVRADDYRRVSAGDTVELVVRSGMLGARYIEDVQPVE